MAVHVLCPHTHRRPAGALLRDLQPSNAARREAASPPSPSTLPNNNMLLPVYTAVHSLTAGARM